MQKTPPFDKKRILAIEHCTLYGSSRDLSRSESTSCALRRVFLQDEMVLRNIKQGMRINLINPMNAREARKSYPGFRYLRFSMWCVHP